MSDVKIEKNVPVQVGFLSPNRGKWTALLKRMEVGDSVVLPLSSAKSLANAAKWKDSGTKITMRKIDEVNYRCWLVDDTERKH